MLALMVTAPIMMIYVGIRMIIDVKEAGLIASAILMFSVWI